MAHTATLEVFIIALLCDASGNTSSVYVKCCGWLQLVTYVLWLWQGFRKYNRFIEFRIPT
jgi:hypothetical protein